MDKKSANSYDEQLIKELEEKFFDEKFPDFLMLVENHHDDKSEKIYDLASIHFRRKTKEFLHYALEEIKRSSSATPLLKKGASDFIEPMFYDIDATRSLFYPEMSRGTLHEYTKSGKLRVGKVGDKPWYNKELLFEDVMKRQFIHKWTIREEEERKFYKNHKPL